MLVSRSGTTGSRGSRRSDTVMESEMDGEVMLRPKPKLLPTPSNGTIVSGTTEDDCTSVSVKRADSTAEEVAVRRPTRTKEEIELSNLKKKTRKRTRRFEVDGVVVTTTTSKVCKFFLLFVLVIREVVL